jgi:hypothetical protein
VQPGVKRGFEFSGKVGRGHYFLTLPWRGRVDATARSGGVG